MSAQKKLTIVLAADLSQFDKNMLAASKRIKNLGKDVQNFGKKVLALGNIMKARGVSALLSAVKIQDAFKTIQVGTGATGEKTERLAGRIQKSLRGRSPSPTGKPQQPLPI